MRGCVRGCVHACVRGCSRIQHVCSTCSTCVLAQDADMRARVQAPNIHAWIDSYADEAQVSLLAQLRIDPLNEKIEQKLVPNNKLRSNNGNGRRGSRAKVWLPLRATHEHTGLSEWRMCDIHPYIVLLRASRASAASSALRSMSIISRPILVCFLQRASDSPSSLTPSSDDASFRASVFFTWFCVSRASQWPPWCMFDVW